MSFKVMGVTAGRKDSNCEILLKEALLVCQEMGAEITMINLKDYNISDDNKGEHLDSLPPDEKMEKARELVMGSHYYAKKEEIRTSLKNALEMMDNQMAATRRKSSSDLMKDLTVNRVIIIILVVVLAALILLTAILITIPALAASRSVRKKERLPVGGAKEFRELTENYNDMFDKLQPPEDGE